MNSIAAVNNQTEIVLQENSIAQLRGWLDQIGARHILLLCEPGRRFVDRILPLLEGLEMDVFDRAKMHVPREIVKEAKKFLESTTADTLIWTSPGLVDSRGDQPSPYLTIHVVTSFTYFRPDNNRGKARALRRR
ncbi:MAG: iron-containing alcohol dehydrogenase [Gammaproteobacteria bacterium]|nr:iron-containing alcohol dehydrogenase [Gammaproteobacteria bacterium]